MINRKTMAAALLTAVGTSSAWGYDFVDGDVYSINLDGFEGGGMTETFDAMSSGNVPATSIYANTAGVSQGSEATDLVGAILPFSDIGSAIFGTLNNGNVPLTVSEALGYNDTWRLNVSYDVGGVAAFVDDVFNLGGAAADGCLDCMPADGIIDVLDAIIPVYNTDGSGTFSIFFDAIGTADGNALDGIQLIDFNLVQADINGADVVFYTEANYDFYGGGSTFVENFFNHTNTGKTFYELWMEDLDPGVVLRADFNVDPSYLPTCVDADCETLVRTTDLNLTTIVKVPAPMTPALFGLGMLVMAWSRKRLKRA